MINAKPLYAVLLLLVLLPLTVQAEIFTLDTLEDKVDARPGDGLCKTWAGKCSLRAAVQESNKLGGYHTVMMSEGTYFLTVWGPDEDEAAGGDLDVTANISFEGHGVTKTIISSRITSKGDRIFDIKDAKINLRNLSLSRGKTDGLGGAILAENSTVNLLNVWLYNNWAAAAGGAIASIYSNVNTEHVLFYSNGSVVGGSIAVLTGKTEIKKSFILYSWEDIAIMGGGIYNFGDLTVEESVFYRNEAMDGGAIYHGMGELKIENTTIANNEAFRTGGGLYYRMGKARSSIARMGIPPVLTNVSIVNNVVAALNPTGTVDINTETQTGTVDPTFTLPFDLDEITYFDPSTLTGMKISGDLTVEDLFTLPEGDQIVIGGGGIAVGRAEDEMNSTVLPIVNSLIVGNITADGGVSDCRMTTGSSLDSFGGNVSGESECGFTHAYDLAPTTADALKLIPFTISDITPVSIKLNEITGIPDVVLPASVDINSLMIPPSYEINNVTIPADTAFTQGVFSHAIPHTQLFLPASALRNAANDMYCPDADQRGQKRPNRQCDIGAYEYLPPIASSMHFIVKPSTSDSSVFYISDPAEKNVMYQIITKPTKGTVSQPKGILFPDWRYRAFGGTEGEDRFTYKACYTDGECSNEATIGINIVPYSTEVDKVTVNYLSGVTARTTGVDIINEVELVETLKDRNYRFPIGALFFSVEDVSTKSLVVELQLPMLTDIPYDAVVRKLDNSGNWRTLSSVASPSVSSGIIDRFNKTITLTLLDNDLFDTNPSVGVIRDPVALAIPETEANISASYSGSNFSENGGGVNIIVLFSFLVVGLSRRLLMFT